MRLIATDDHFFPAFVALGGKSFAVGRHPKGTYVSFLLVFPFIQIPRSPMSLPLRYSSRIWTSNT